MDLDPKFALDLELEQLRQRLEQLRTSFDWAVSLHDDACVLAKTGDFKAAADKLFTVWTHLSFTIDSLEAHKTDVSKAEREAAALHPKRRAKH